MDPFEHLIVEEFGLRICTYSILGRAEITNLGQLLAASEDELLAQPGSFMGREVAGIKVALAVHGLRLHEPRRKATA